jgi:competence protein ComEC
MGQGTLRALRASNLAHLLAISGLHMGLLTGFVFAVIRFGFALIPFVALRWPVKKIAAAAALMAGAAYLAISGGNVATERAFIMVGVMLCAILLGRRALTLRAVAMAAVIVLLLRPEALTGPGFQMSFAATTALVAVFGSLRSFQKLHLPGWIKSIAAVVISSAVAGLATAPFAAAHFNQIAHFGLIANLLSVPLMGILVMPAAVLTACLAPLGLAWVGLELMRLGLVWILGVAHWISERDGALGHVITPDPVVIPLMTFGFLTVILWQGRARWVGLAPAIIAFVLWDQTERPNVLVAQSGALIGVLTPEGRALNKQKGDGFTAQNWLENDGNPIPQADANALAGIDVDGKISNITLGEFSITQIAGQRALSAFPDCSGASLLVTTVEDEIERSCPVFDVPALRLTGALAIYTDGEEIKIVTASDLSGARLWNTRAARINALSFGQFEFLNTFE